MENSLARGSLFVCKYFAVAYRLPMRLIILKRFSGYDVNVFVFVLVIQSKHGGFSTRLPQRILVVDWVMTSSNEASIFYFKHLGSSGSRTHVSRFIIMKFVWMTRDYSSVDASHRSRRNWGCEKNLKCNISTGGNDVIN